MNFNWECPFCGRHTTITEERYSRDVHRVTIPNRLGPQGIHTLVVACPNEACKELLVKAWMSPCEHVGGSWKDGEATEKWTLRPLGAAKPLPAYIPEPIARDYREACLIVDLSPKASATLSRRCLQGMIRDFWNIAKNRLIDEIKALEGVVDAATWKAIDAIREIGNIGAHMEKDIDVIVDVDANEATLLVRLIETLIDDWYVQRHEREERMTQIVSAAASKKAAKQAAAKP